MTSLLFPSFAPSEHPIITAGRFPHVRKRATGGRQSLIRLANVQLDGEIKLVYINITTNDLFQLAAHWQLVRGTARDFALPAELFPSMDSNTRERLMVTAWRFKDAPKVTDICGGAPGFLLHSLEITLRAQPRRVASPTVNGLPELPVVAPGARWGAVMTWEPGLAGINTIRPRGAEWTVRVGWQKGGAHIVGDRMAPGAAWNVTTSWASGGQITSAANWDVRVLLIPGKASIEGLAPGAALNATATFTGGAASVPPQAAGGAALNVSAAWSGGAGNITGGTAPGAALNVTSSWVGGKAQSIGPGAVLNVTAAWVGGGSGTDPNFSSVSLLLAFDGANNSTTFIDLSIHNHAITRYGNAVISTANPKYGTGSLLLSSGSDFLFANSMNQDSGNGDFTIECDCMLFANGAHMGLVTLSNLAIYVLNGNWLVNGAGFGAEPAANTWTHIALIRRQSFLKFFVNGLQVQSDVWDSSYYQGQYCGIGWRENAIWRGRIDNFRITKGVARYTANFTPPSGPHPTS